MLLPDTAERDASGVLVVGGCPLPALAERFGTPLYVLDEATVRGRLRAYRRGLAGWPAGGEVHYGAKAYLGAAMVRLLVEEGCGVDVVSATELAVVIRYGMPASRVAFAGNNKDADELEAAAAAGIGLLVVDGFHELDLLAAAPPRSRPLPALLRLSPAVAPDTHDHISTGQLDSKFGFPLATGAADAALARALRIDRIRVRGVHVHLGSQIRELGVYREAAALLAGWLDAARRRHGFTAAALSIGGGLGVAHTAAETVPSALEFMTVVTESLGAELGARGLPLPELHVEPGRSVIGPAMVAVYRVGGRKEVLGVRTYVAVDGGMADNLRPSLYGAVYQPLAVVDDPAAPRETVTLAGRYCESGDVLVRDAVLPRLRPGDLVAVPAAGAYTLSMASNYNAALRPAVVAVAAGAARLVRRRERLDDLLRCEVDP